MSTLRALGGWDAYNVTEDADLGVRLARRGMKTSTTTACTYEEAPLHVRPWLGQRTRWMKGWLQTFVVHNRRPRLLLADLGWSGFSLFHILILGMILSPLLHMGFLLGLAVSFLAGIAIGLSIASWAPAYIAILLVGYGAAILTNLFGLLRTRQTELLPLQILMPVYWLLVAVATLRAFIEFAHKPFYWFKTPHAAVRTGADKKTVG